MCFRNLNIGQYIFFLRLCDKDFHVLFNGILHILGNNVFLCIFASKMPVCSLAMVYICLRAKKTGTVSDILLANLILQI